MDDILKEIRESLNYKAIKEGDIKIDSGEFRALMDIVVNFRDTINQDAGQHIMNYEEDFITYMYNKYILLGNLRLEQKKWFDVHQQIKKLKGTLTEKESVEREVWGYYIQAKMEREELQKLVDEEARKFDNPDKKC